MNKTQVLSTALLQTLSYSDYIELIERLHKEEKATSFQDDPAFYQHSKMSLTRMSRIYKRHEVGPNLLEAVKAIDQKQTWLLITESWCGDASQTVPVIARLAAENDRITLRLALRDSNPELMAHYLTNGGQSIPILAILDSDNNEIGRWGPRPEEAQNKVVEYKALPEPRPPYEELSADLQRWYTKDKGLTTEAEILELLKGLQS